MARWQLLEIGMSAPAIDYWLRTGRLHCLYRGVYAVGHAAVTPRGRLMAAVLACGPGAVLSHRDAAQLWGIWSSARSAIDVTAPSRGRRQRRGITLHQTRTLDPKDITRRDRIPVTTPARTLLDLADVLNQRQLERALENAEKQQLLDLTALRRTLARTPGRHGAHKLTSALRSLNPEAQHTRSELERLFLDFCRDHQIPLPAMNVVVEGMTVDALWRSERLIVEIDSRAHHDTSRQFEEDRRRDAILQAAGFPVVRITHERLTREAAAEAARLLATLAQRRSSAAPTIVSASIP